MAVRPWLYRRDCTSLVAAARLTVGRDPINKHDRHPTETTHTSGDNVIYLSHITFDTQLQKIEGGNNRADLPAEMIWDGFEDSSRPALA